MSESVHLPVCLSSFRTLHAPRSPYLTGADVAGLCEPIVLHEELAGGQRLGGARHGLWEQLLDLFDGPYVEGALFGPRAPLRGRVCILCTVEAPRLWGGESWLAPACRAVKAPEPSHCQARLPQWTHTRWLRFRVTYCRMPLATSE